jgi:hypothetical protein
MKACSSKGNAQRRKKEGNRRRCQQTNKKCTKVTQFGLRGIIHRTPESTASWTNHGGPVTSSNTWSMQRNRYTPYRGRKCVVVFCHKIIGHCGPEGKRLIICNRDDGTRLIGNIRRNIRIYQRSPPSGLPHPQEDLMSHWKGARSLPLTC